MASAVSMGMMVKIAPVSNAIVVSWDVCGPTTSTYTTIGPRGGRATLHPWSSNAAMYPGGNVSWEKTASAGREDRLAYVMDAWSISSRWGLWASKRPRSGVVVVRSISSTAISSHSRLYRRRIWPMGRILVFIGPGVVNLAVNPCCSQPRESGVRALHLTYRGAGERESFECGMGNETIRGGEGALLRRCLAGTARLRTSSFDEASPKLQRRRASQRRGIRGSGD